MKKLLSLLLSALMVVSCMTFLAAGAEAEDGTEDTPGYKGELTVIKVNNLFQAPTDNVLMISTPGQTINAKYWTKLYARLDKDTGDYIVEEKVGCHRDYPKTVEKDCIGIMINYSPLTTTGSALAIQNWKVFDRIKIGDRLTLQNIDLVLGTVKSSGTYGSSDYVSDSKVIVTEGDYEKPNTPYSDKTIVAMGDSVTVGGGWTYALGDAIGADIINSGFGGDTADAAFANRYNKYVADYNPDIVIVSYGINDAASIYNYGNLEGAMDKYEKALRDIQAKNAEIGAKTVFQTPNNINTAYFEGRSNGAYAAYGDFQGYLDQFIDRMRVVAEDTGSQLIDLYSAWRVAGYGGDAAVNMFDSCHPNGDGYDFNLSVMLPFWKENYKTLTGYEGDFDFDSSEEPSEDPSEDPSQNPEEPTGTYDLGTLTVCAVNGLWTTPTNALAVFTPGQSMNGKYYTKLYARLDKATGDYVVEEKIGCHRDYPKVVERDCIGVMMNYAPLTPAGSAIAIENWKIIDRIKIGDRLTLSGVDLVLNKADVKGTFGQADFESNAKIKVTACREAGTPKTPYSDKTIVAMGDSVTVGGGWTYDLGDAIGADIINSGFGGDTADASLAARYNTYVAAYKPDIVIVSFGINDAGSSFAYSDLEGAMDKYEKALRDIKARNDAIGAKTVFQTPNNVKIQFWEERAPKGTYEKYGGFQGYLDVFLGRMKTVAEDTGCPFIDLYSAWKKAGYGGWDGVNMLDNSHPNEVGYDLNLSVMIPFWKENYKTLTGYEGDFDFDVKGDMNLDGICDNLDAAALLKSDAGLVTIAEKAKARADMNEDGEADNLDAVIILRLDAGL